MTGPGTGATPAAGPIEATFDHVLLATSDIAEASRRLRDRFGLGSVAGGSHPWGTANRVVPLDPPCYLELLSIKDRAKLLGDREGTVLDARLRSGDFWAGWALRVDDVEDVADRLGTQLEAGETLRPDGSRSRWTTTSPIEEGDGGFPFFIRYEHPADRLGRFEQLARAADHERPVGPVRWIEVAVAPSTEASLALLRIDVEVRRTEPALPGNLGVRAIGLEIGGRVVEIR